MCLQYKGILEREREYVSGKKMTWGVESELVDHKFISWLVERSEHCLLSTQRGNGVMCRCGFFIKATRSSQLIMFRAEILYLYQNQISQNYGTN
jgi:hypothetical protein